MTTASNAKAIPFRFNRHLHILCGVFAIVWVVSAIHPIMPEDWWVENGLVFVCLGLLIVSYRWLVFSELSYLLIFVFLCMHEWGAHHRYANVPVGEWVRQLFHTTRNDYDRVVHFAFGLLLFYPQREVLMRKAKVSWSWSIWLPPVLILGYGAGYEIIEAVAATLLSPDAGDAFLGLQGDPWDTHKDMFMAFAGALIAMTTTAIATNRRRIAGRRLSSDSAPEETRSIRR